MGFKGLALRIDAHDVEVSDECGLARLLLVRIAHIVLPHAIRCQLRQVTVLEVIHLWFLAEYKKQLLIILITIINSWLTSN